MRWLTTMSSSLIADIERVTELRQSLTLLGIKRSLVGRRLVLFPSFFDQAEFEKRVDQHEQA